MHKGPLDYSYVTYIWVILLSMWGGIAAFIQRVRASNTSTIWCNFRELLGDLFISGGTGVLTFYLCELAKTPPLLSAVLIAVSGHMGTKIIVMLETALTKKLNTIVKSQGDTNE